MAENQNPPLSLDDERELARFKKEVTARNADLVGEKRFRGEYNHWLVELFEPGGNVFQEYNFKTEAGADAATEHANNQIPKA